MTTTCILIDVLEFAKWMSISTSKKGWSNASKMTSTSSLYAFRNLLHNMTYYNLERDISSMQLSRAIFDLFSWDLWDIGGKQWNSTAGGGPRPVGFLCNLNTAGDTVEAVTRSERSWGSAATTKLLLEITVDSVDYDKHGSPLHGGHTSLSPTGVGRHRNVICIT